MTHLLHLGLETARQLRCHSNRLNAGAPVIWRRYRSDASAGAELRQLDHLHYQGKLVPAALLRASGSAALPRLSFRRLCQRPDGSPAGLRGSRGCHIEVAAGDVDSLLASPLEAFIQRSGGVQRLVDFKAASAPSGAFFAMSSIRVLASLAYASHCACAQRTRFLRFRDDCEHLSAMKEPQEWLAL
ncbi:hypothetical protein CUJ88_49660 (plasmid) [Paraburkholderia hospita]|nr:hypothetical protein CUJ88_49660 [Paraburkholderia hospita]